MFKIGDWVKRTGEDNAGWVMGDIYKVKNIRNNVIHPGDTRVDAVSFKTGKLNTGGLADRFELLPDDEQQLYNFNNRLESLIE